jgi:hypothetical protein
MRHFLGIVDVEVTIPSLYKTWVFLQKIFLTQNFLENGFDSIQCSGCSLFIKGIFPNTFCHNDETQDSLKITFEVSGRLKKQTIFSLSDTFF